MVAHAAGGVMSERERWAYVTVAGASVRVSRELVADPEFDLGARVAARLIEREGSPDALHGRERCGWRWQGASEVDGAGEGVGAVDGPA